MDRDMKRVCANGGGFVRNTFLIQACSLHGLVTFSMKEFMTVEPQIALTCIVPL